MSPYDTIVVGAGGVGSAALWQLASRGARVLGIDRFAPPHDRGSSHGQTRIIRQAYFEHSDYVPLLLSSYGLWRYLERLAGEELLRETGLLQVGPPDGIVVPGVLRAAQAHGLAVEGMTADAIQRRWPSFLVPRGLVGVYEPSGGLLHVEKCVAACLVAAREAGAETLFDVEVLGWSGRQAGLQVRTSAGDFTTRRLVVAAGPWAGKLLQRSAIPLTVRRQTVTWHRALDASPSPGASCPCFLFELPTGVFYGIPPIDARGTKIGEHTNGLPVDDPLDVDRTLHSIDAAGVRQFVAAHMPGVSPDPSSHSVCLYTMSPDEHFIVDRDPDDARIVFAAGLSGHGYKFAPVLGKALAEMALDDGTDLPIGFLSLRRFR